MKPKIKNDLAYLYELPEFASFKKFCEMKRQKVAEQIIGTDMGVPGADCRIAMFQGQAYTLEYLILELKSIHKKEMEKEKR